MVNSGAGGFSSPATLTSTTDRPKQHKTHRKAVARTSKGSLDMVVVVVVSAVLV